MEGQERKIPQQPSGEAHSNRPTSFIDPDSGIGVVFVDPGDSGNLPYELSPAMRQYLNATRGMAPDRRIEEVALNQFNKLRSVYPEYFPPKEESQ